MTRIDKNTLRKSALRYRKNMSDCERRRSSESIIATLLAHVQCIPKPPVCLLVYRSLPTEVDTERLFHLPTHQVFAPVTHHHEHMEWLLTSPQTTWKNGLFGIREPSSGMPWTGGSQNTVLLCPLTAFDRHGNRLGMGKGCFDYWLNSYHHQINQVIGLAFSGQEVAHIPAEGHDVPMDYIITEKEVITCLKV